MRPTGPQGRIRRRSRIRARAGAVAPGAIARISRRIDILKPSLAFPRSRGMVNRALPGAARSGCLTETRAETQGANMSARMTFLVAAMLLLAVAPACAACGGAIAEFESIVASDARTGNLNKGVYGRIVAELGPVKAQCGAGHDAQA